MSLKLVVLATGEFALPTFKALIKSEHQVIALVTQPDRVNPRGVAHPHPLKEYAIKKGIPVYQPESIKSPEAIRKLQAMRPDVGVVAAYGQILSAEVIGIPRLGMYNLHASLLPRHRGAAPIQYAVWKGDRTTGVTIFRIEPKLDAGPMIVKHQVDIEQEETSGELHDRLSGIGAEAFLEALSLIESGHADPLPQDDSQVTLSPKIRKEQGEINWSQTCFQIDCHVRAMQPWPNAFTFLHQPEKPPERLLILKVSAFHKTYPTAPPGTILHHDAHHLIVQAGDGPLQILLLQKAGKKPMEVEAYLRGNPLTGNEFLGNEIP